MAIVLMTRIASEASELVQLGDPNDHAAFAITSTGKGSLTSLLSRG